MAKKSTGSKAKGMKAVRAKAARNAAKGGISRSQAVKEINRGNPGGGGG